MADETTDPNAPKPSVYKWKKPQQGVGTRLTFNYNKRGIAKKTIGTTRQLPNK